jgi:peroxiredoxin Q/BCP
MTDVCTKVACGFRDDMSKLAEKGVEVVGVSGDGVKNHQVFKAAHKLNFGLLADEKGAVAKQFGVPVDKGGVFKTKDADGKEIELTRGVTTQRWIFVIRKDGRIAYMNNDVTSVEDSKWILGVVETLK